MDEIITEKSFTDEWGVFSRSSGDLFQYEDVRSQPINHVWTIMESGDDADTNWYACPGFHVVNQLGYVMTKRPWIDATRDAIYFLDDFGDE